jgi:hypothetical protein
MLDTLQTVKKFKQIYGLHFRSGYVPIENFDFGPVFPLLVTTSRRNSFACGWKNLLWTK